MSANAIEAEGLAKRFGSVTALSDVDLIVPAGTVLGLLGPNGAGKTTAVRILTTILRPDAGTARVLDIDVVQHPDLVRAQIGLAGQYAAVDENLTGTENLRLIGRLTHQPRNVVKQRADELIEQFALEDAADRPTRTYSGGMRRRLDLAAALVHRPPVLFLDEPTTGLDPQGRLDLWTTISDLVADGTTVLLTTQYLDEADRLADRIVVIDKGRVIANGTATQLKARFGRTVVEVRLPTGAVDRARAVLDSVGPTDLAEAGRSIAVRVDDGARAAVQIVRKLDADGIEPESIEVRAPTLDDVFLQVTGHRVFESEEAA